jgi:hypothetical protein
MASTTDGRLAEDAASYIGGNTNAVQRLDGSPTEIDRQSGLLVAWAIKNRAILPVTYFSGLRQLGGTTAEHVVYVHQGDNRAIKQTHAGTFGVTPDAKGKQTGATPLFYLRRILLMNRVFDSRIRLEGVFYAKSYVIGKTDDLHPCIVVSQPWYRAAMPSNPHPSDFEIKEFMEVAGFEQKGGSYFGWFKKDEKILVIDARPDNFIKTTEGVVPIDLVISEEP